MKRSAPLIVIRRGVLVAGLAAAVLITILAYLLGRAGIGLSGPGPFASGADLREAVRDREATIRELRRGAAELDTLRAGQTLERRELSRTVESLQAEVARQRQQLQVYENVVSRGEPVPGATIRSVSLAPGSTAGERILRLTLVQSGTPSAEVAGRVRVALEGRRAGGGGSIERVALGEWPYRFRYFATLEPRLSAPPGFSVTRVSVVVMPERAGAKMVTQTLEWAPAS